MPEKFQREARLDYQDTYASTILQEILFQELALRHHE
uniref:Uncharacterized protein n=1 Tax=Siphoviridae sp. ctx254 TaxID=2825737 RepID=A0A8S5TVR4_9CAUD|nr:MAG TPA: hypothetical protein [Siphoviridae sp. ctx254]